MALHSSVHILGACNSIFHKVLSMTTRPRYGNIDTPHYYQRATADDADIWRAVWCQYHPRAWQVYAVEGGTVPRLLGTTVSRRRARRLVDALATGGNFA